MHVVIIGNGISGVTAARWVRKLSDHKVTIISKETDYFFSRTALMYIYMGHMRFVDTQPYENDFWTKNRIDLLRATVTEIDFVQKELVLQPEINSGHRTAPTNLKYDKLVLALGSEPNKFGWPGQDLDRVQHLYSYQDLELLEKNTPGLKQAVIVGGGLIGIELAEMLHTRHIPVSILIREKEYWSNALPLEEAAMVSQHILDHGIDLRKETELKEIEGDDQGRAIRVHTNTGDVIDCQLVGLTAGVHPNIHFLKDGAIEHQRGILVDDHLQTNVQDVYAIGDCVQLRNPKAGRRPIEAVWYTGRMMGEVVAYNICGHEISYDPGIWFNSAKFFDIEYQVYGTVLSRPPENHKSLFWKHADNTKSIRLVYDKDSLQIIGFNLMGIRFRHEVCEKWIASNVSVEEVLQNIELAEFDPEFYDSYIDDLIAAYNAQEGRQVRKTNKKGLNKVLKFLKQSV